MCHSGPASRDLGRREIFWTPKRRTTMTAPREERALAVLRVALGALFVWVFFENLGKGAYTPAGYN